MLGMKVNETFQSRAIAIAYWMATASTMAGFYFLAEATAGDDLHTWASQRALLSLGIVLQLINDACVVFIGLQLYGLLRSAQHGVGRAVLVTRLMEAVILVTGKLGLLLLPRLAEMEGEAAATVIGTIVQDVHAWSFVVGMLPLGVGGTVLSFFLWKRHMIPRTLAVLGMVGYMLLFAKSVVALFFIELSDWLFLPVGVFEFVFPVWLWARGLKRSSV